MSLNDENQLLQVKQFWHSNSKNTLSILFSLVMILIVVLLCFNKLLYNIVGDQEGEMHNTEWAVIVEEYDGISMVVVPRGCFDMGNEPNAFYWNDDENYVQGVPDGGEQCFEEPFWLDQTEVTQADFERLGGEKTSPNRFVGNTLPVENITWFEASEFCQLRGMRLPTEAEWEYAARGPDALFFPWGNEFVANNAVYLGSSNNQTANVGSHPDGVSWVGAMDMSGNVWEWVSSLYQDYPYDVNNGREMDTGSRTDVSYAMRGGSWIINDNGLRVALRYSGNPDGRNSYVGFRCAKSD